MCNNLFVEEIAYKLKKKKKKSYPYSNLTSAYTVSGTSFPGLRRRPNICKNHISLGKTTTTAKMFKLEHWKNILTEKKRTYRNHQQISIIKIIYFFNWDQQILRFRLYYHIVEVNIWAEDREILQNQWNIHFNNQKEFPGAKQSANTLLNTVHDCFSRLTRNKWHCFKLTKKMFTFQWQVL